MDQVLKVTQVILDTKDHKGLEDLMVITFLLKDLKVMLETKVQQDLQDQKVIMEMLDQ